MKNFHLTSGVVSASILFAVASPAAPGSLDTTFGKAGKVTTKVGVSHDYASSVAVIPGGKFLVAGYYATGGNFKFALARYNPGGTLDTSFGVGGIAKTSIGPGHDVAHSLIVQPNGKILVIGDSHNGSNYDFAIVRYTSTGILDKTFNGTGKVTTAIGQGNDSASSVVIQADGKIIVAGSSSASNGADPDFALVRYNYNGSLDATFNGTGKVVTPVGDGEDYISDMALQKDGKIVVAGNSYTGADSDFSLARFTTSGALDTTFNSTGIVIAPVGGHGEAGAYGVVLQTDNKIVLAGAASNGVDYDFALARFTDTGAVDPTFNGTGQVTTPIGSSYDVIYDVALQKDGKLIVAGFYSKGNENFDLALARYRTNGTLDTGFGTGGKVTTVFGSDDEEARSIAMNASGNIIAVGFTRTAANTDFAIARYKGK